MLVYNTFRNLRYLRTLFSEGRYLLASENSDLELEMLDQIRQNIEKSFGDIAIGNAWKVQYSSQNSLLINPGTSWVKGLPFTMRDGRDHLVTGAVSIGQSVVPSGVTLTDSNSGKVATFTLGTTPTGQYTVVISATEETIDSTSDPFLQNVNVPEATASKKRLVYGINIVPTSAQTETPVPYIGDGYYGDTGNNLVNQINVTCPSGVTVTNLLGNGKNIDGRSYEISIPNSTNAIPNTGTFAALSFNNGKLIDTVGNIYWLNGIVLGSNPVTIRVDAEIDQLQPTFNTGDTFSLIKADVYSTNDSGSAQGKLFYSVATINWDITSGFVHDSVVQDLRNNVLEQDIFEEKVEEKSTLQTINGGDFSLSSDSTLLTWDADINLVGPSFSTQTITAGNSYLVDGGFLVYELDLTAVSAIAKGNLAVTTTTTGTSISLSGSPDLSNVSKGNIFVIGSQASEILDIDNVNKTLTLASSVSSSGAATIYQDSYASSSYLTDINTYVLATRSGTNVTVANVLVLQAGQSAKLGIPNSSGVVKATLYDAVDTTLPTGSSATIDGVSVANDDTVLFSNLSSGNNEVYKVSGVGTSLVWTPVTLFSGTTTPTSGDLVVLEKGTQFGNQIAQFNGTTFEVNNTVRYFNGTDFWEQSSIQSSTLTDNSSGTVFSVTASGSENIVLEYSISRGGVKETGTLWITSDGVSNAYVATGSVESSDTGVSFSAAISAGNLELNYTTTATGSSATMKYVVSRWSDAAGGPTGLPSYTPSTNTIVAAAFVMSDNSGTPLNCLATFNVSGKTRVQLNFNYYLSRNAGSTVGDLDVYVNGQRYPRFVTGTTVDGYYTEISNNTIEFNTDLTVSALSIEIIKKV